MQYSTLGARINGFALLTLSESRLERLGMSIGFHVILMSIIENLICDIHVCLHVYKYCECIMISI